MRFSIFGTRGTAATFVVIVLLAALSYVPSLEAAIYHVTKTADTDDGSCDADCSLREAVIAANAEPDFDTISVPPGTYFLDHNNATCTDDNTAHVGDLDILYPVFIGGHSPDDTIINAGGPGACTRRIFDVQGPIPGPIPVSICCMTLTGAHDGGTGGAIFVNQTNLVLSWVSINGNSVSLEGGGAIACVQGAVTVQDDSVIYNNWAPRAGAIMSNQCDVTISESTISANSAAGHGGALYLFTTAELPHTLSISDSSIVSNQAGMDAGGVYLRFMDTAIDSSTIAYNEALGGVGGGLVIDEMSTLAGLVNSSVFGNDSDSGGAGIHVWGSGAVYLHSVTLFDNVSGDDTTITNDGNIVFINCLIGGACGGPGTFTSEGGNVLSGNNSCGLSAAHDHYAAGDLMLSGPALVGGPTAVLLPAPGSPAINNGSDVYCKQFDQRGLERNNGLCDAGAVERRADDNMLFTDPFESGRTAYWSSTVGD